MQPSLILVSPDHGDFLLDEFGRYRLAVGDIRSGSMKRVAAASGEGASVVPLVHSWVAEPGAPA